MEHMEHVREHVWNGCSPYKQRDGTRGTRKRACARARVKLIANAHARNTRASVRITCSMCSIGIKTNKNNNITCSLTCSLTCSMCSLVKKEVTA